MGFTHPLVGLTTRCCLLYMGFTFTRFSTLTGEKKKKQLKQAVLERFRADFDWRESSVEPFGNQSGQDSVGTHGTIGGGFREAARLFESRSTDTDEDGIPHVNLIRRAVEDFLAVIIGNFPKARLYAPRYLPGADVEEWERQMRLMVIEQAEDVINAYAKAIMKDNDYQSISRKALFQAGIFGVGYIYMYLDKSLDLRQSYELRTILSQEELSPKDISRLKFLSKRISFDHIDTRDVYWEAGKRDVTKCIRVSIVEREALEVVRENYEDEVEDVRLIRPGKFPYEVAETELADSAHTINDDNIVAVVTMYELEPVSAERVVTDSETEEEVVHPFTNWVLHKVVIAGGEVVEHNQHAGISMEGVDEQGPIKFLPVVPLYVKESSDHPYGYSLPLMLELSEKFINAMRAIVYKSAKRAVSTQGVVVAIPNLGDGDLDELEYVLEEGGVGRIKGNNNLPFDIRDMVMPLNYNAAPINPSLMQAINMEMNAFNMQSQSVDMEALGSARSGSGKRAQIMAADRPKGLSIETVAKGVRRFYDTLFEYINSYHNEEIQVEVDIPGQGREVVTLNEHYSAVVPVEDPNSPLGIVFRVIEATLNPTNIIMHAESETFGGLPLDMISRFQILVALQQAQILTPDTVRRLVLEDEIKAIDDIARARLQEQQAALQQSLLQQQFLESPEIQRRLGGGAPTAGLSPTPNEVAQDQIQPIFG